MTNLIRLVWDAVALHTNIGIVEYKETEAALMKTQHLACILGRLQTQAGNDINVPTFAIMSFLPNGRSNRRNLIDEKGAACRGAAVSFLTL